MNKAVEDYLAIKAYKREQRKKKLDATLRRLPFKPIVIVKVAVTVAVLMVSIWLIQLFSEYNSRTRRQQIVSAEMEAKWQARQQAELIELAKGPAWVRWMQDADQREREKIAGTRTADQSWCDVQIESALRKTRGLTPPPLWKPADNLKNQPWCSELVTSAIWNIESKIETPDPSLAKELEDEASGAME
jgi:type II secretory pathway pseudopilin PulG